MKKFIQEFKEFAIQGNAFDLAIGVVIGGAFGAIINSLVTNIIGPLIGFILPTGDLENWVIVLKENAELGIGPFIQSIITFLITAFALFLVVKGMNAFRNRSKKPKVEEVVEVELTAEELLLTQILDELKKNNTK